MNPMLQQWIDYQRLGALKVITECSFTAESVRLVGGLDISFDKKDPARACGFLTVWDCIARRVVYEDHEICNMDIPYVSGFLGFREIGVYRTLLCRVVPQFMPQVLFIDGNGILHPRGFGSASHIGVELNIPTIGIAKTLLCMDGLSEADIKERLRSYAKGNRVDLVGTSGMHYGVALKTASSPIYVSVGHKVSIEVAAKLVLNTCLYKIPEPIRHSDIQSKKWLLK
jgi:deoxyinosine 3'endonuclease (endonuclease V)